MKEYESYWEEQEKDYRQRREERRAIRLKELKRRRRRRRMTFLGVLLTLVVVIVIGTIHNTIGKKAREEEEAAKQLVLEQKQKATNEMEQLLLGYYCDEAAAVLASCTAFSEEEVFSWQEKITARKNMLVPFEGEVPHIFFHCLIVYPELAFDGEYTQDGYDAWMVTTKEFSAMLDQLYAKNYILIRMQDLYTENPDGTITENTLYLPEGKTPLVISIDDVCYYPYMAGDGFAHKLVLENGLVRTEVVTPSGEIAVTGDGDVIPILDDFVKAHPDFSWRGAKGVIAVTGYEGLLGYRVSNEDDIAFAEAEKKAVRPIIQALYDTGWEFASHSFTHNDYFKDYSVTMEQMKYDSDKWQRMIGSVIDEIYGEVNTFISPFGVLFNKEDERMHYLMDNFNFKAYCPVDSTPMVVFYDTYFTMNRCAIDGVSLRGNQEVLSRYFDCNSVYDTRRPY